MAESATVIVQLSDPHLVAPGRMLMGRIDTAALLAQAVAAVGRLRPAPAAVLLTGDLVDAGRADEYAHLRTLLAPQLPLEAALVLRDVYEYSNEEAAKSLGLDLGTLRHRLASARETMMRRYDRLCSLVSKEGVCYQCEGLRQAAPADRQGDEPRGALPGAASTRDERWKRRLEVLRDPRADGERTRAMHDVLARQLDALESTRPDADDVEDIPTPGSNCAPTGEA